MKQTNNLSDKELKNLFPEDTTKNIQKANEALKKYNNLLKDDAKKEKELREEITKKEKEYKKFQEKNQGKIKIDDTEYVQWSQELEATKARLNQLGGKRLSFENKQNKGTISEEEIQKFKEVKQEIDDLTAKKDELEFKINTHVSDKGFNEFETAIQGAKQKLVDFLNTSSNDAALQELFNDLQKIDGVDLSNITRDLEGAQQVIDGLTAEQMAKLQQSFTNAQHIFNNTGDAVENMRHDMNNGSNSIKEMTEEAQELLQLKNRLISFFGINNAVNIFQRAIRDAFNTVKELDAAMTETAVVTDYSVGDMWEQLPQYTAAANELGTTTLGAYQTMTLFYQQGLKTNEAFAIGTETMKMARIANMDYAQATDMMTAALRGFNMELNETSAQRVNDVYSELAAITAADTEEIAIAMTKTASIAASANMEFETTAALLSQIIETTREAPETAGTAMKTIIARFTEVKKLFDQGQLTGKDSEGEVININKIDEALKSVGLSLQGFLRGEQGIDDIFLELASKWDTLDLSTQRYIATMAAGSRQQSRFLAMMSDYGRTMELVDAANNSAGASQRQFEKTIESLESKLNKLKNAWNEFTMGLANSKLVKGAVDILTGILNTANKITNVFGGGLLSSILKVGLALNALKFGKIVIGASSVQVPKILQSEGGQKFSKIFALDQFFDTKNGSEGKIEKAGNTFLASVIEAGKKWISDVTSAGNIEKADAVEEGVIEKGGKHASNHVKLFGGTKGKHTAASGTAILGGKAGIAGLLPTTVITALIIAAIAAVAGTIYNKSLAGRTKDAERIDKAIQESAQATRDSITQMRSLRDTYTDSQNKIQEAENFQERNQAIAESNKSLLEIIKQEPELIEKVSWGKDGQIEIDTAGLDASITHLEEVLNGAEFAEDMSQVALKGLALERTQEQMQTLEQDYLNETVYGILTPEREEYYEVRRAELRNQEQIDRLDMQNAIQTAFGNIIPENISDELASQLLYTIATNLNATEFSYAAKGQVQGGLNWGGTDWWGRTFGEYGLIGTRKNGSIDEQYERLFGPAAAGMSRKDKIDAIAQRKASDAEIEKFSAYIDAVQGNTALQDLVALASGEYTGNIDEINVGSITAEEWEAAKDYLGVEEDESYDAFIQRQTAEYERMRSALRQELYTSLFSYADKTSSPINLDAIQNLDVESQERMMSFMDAIQHFSDEGKGAAWSFMPAIVQDAEKFASIIDSIDFQNPIAMARDLQNILEDETHFAHGFAEALWSSESQFLSLQSQLKYLMSSEGYAGVIEQVEELIDVNGELTGDDIEELADDCQELRDMLDESTLSAEALAKALTQIELGELNVDQLTDDVLQALSSVQELDQFFRNGESMRENFDEGRDYAEGYEWLSGLFEELQENVNNYEFGNERTVNLAKALFGEDAFESIDTAYNRQNPEAYFAAYQNQIARFSDLMENNGEGFAKALVDAHILTTDGKKYEFNKELTGNMSTVVDEIAKALNIGTEGAQMLWENYLAHDRDLTVKYQEGLVAEATEAFKDSKITDNELYATADEIDAMAKALAMTPQQIEDFKTSLKEAGIAIVDWSNKTGKEILDSLDEIFGDNIKAKLQASLISEDGINYHQAISELSKYGIFGEQADSVIMEMAQRADQAITATVKFWEDGKLIEKQLKMGEDETLQSFLARVAETQSKETQESAIAAATDENWGTTNDLLSQILSALVLLNPNSEEYKAAEADRTSEKYFNAAKIAEGAAEAATNAEEAAFAAQKAAEASTELAKIAEEAKEQGLPNADDLEERARQAEIIAEEAARAAQKYDNEVEVPPAFTAEDERKEKFARNASVEEPATVGDAPVEELKGASILDGIKAFGNWMNRVAEENGSREDYVADATMNQELFIQTRDAEQASTISETPSVKDGDYVGWTQEEIEAYNDIWKNLYANDPSIPSFSLTPQDAEETAEVIVEELTPVITETSSEEDEYAPEVKEAKEETVPLEAISSGVESVVTNTGETTASVVQLSTVIMTDNPTEKDYSSVEATTKKEKIEVEELKAEVTVDTAEAEAQLNTLTTDNLKAEAEEASTALTTAVTEGVTGAQADLDSIETTQAQVSAQQLGSSIASSASAGAGAAQSYINSIQGKTVYVNVITNKQTKNAAAGGIVPSYASGSANRKIEAGIALTGEEDPEIIWNKEQGYAYIAGENGPEFNHLQPGDRVFNAQETKEIFRRSGRSAAKGGIISAAAGWGAPESEGSSGGGGKSSGSGSKENKPSEWKNEFDWLYNLVEDIVELERERNKIVERYQDLLEDNNASAQDLVNATVDELKNLYGQQARQQSVYEKRQQEMNDYLAHYSQYAAYGGYNFEDQTVEINWDAIEAIQDEDYYGDVKEYIEGLEEIQDKMDEADDALLDINNEIQEIEERFLEAYTSFENRVLDAIVNLRQKEIDELSNINSTIKDTNSRLFDAVQKSLSLQRQDRENAKTEEEIAKKERRLAFLRQDTSNDNTISIRELEKELDELKEDYTDELIDQKLDFLQDQEDFAAEQRERQIELMESQLAFEQETGQLWAQVEDLIMNAMGPDGKLLEGSELVSILQAGETWESLSAAQQKVWQDTLIGEFNEALAYLLFEKTDLSVIKENTFNEAMNDIITELQNVSKSIANIKFTYSDSGGGSGGSSGGAVGGGQPVTQPTTCSGCQNNCTGSIANYTNGYNSTGCQGNCTGSCYTGCNTYCEGGCKSTCTTSCAQGCAGYCAQSCSTGCGTTCATSCSNKCTTSCHSGCKGSASPTAGARQQVYYDTGGYTGDWSGNEGKLAVLHKKELILNAKDTANFIELKEVLASGTLDALSTINPANTSNISGDTYIDITVEAELKNDYDVDQLTKKIKSEIYKDGSYRGVNVIHKIR